MENEHRSNVGIEPCLYCGEVNCDYDCDESQADGFNEENEGPFICSATGCGYFDGPAVAFGSEPKYCKLHETPPA